MLKVAPKYQGYNTRKIAGEVDEIRRAALEDRCNVFTKRSDSHSFSPYQDFDMRDLDKP